MPKVNAKKIKFGGITFDSIAEKNRYVVLRRKESDGEISNLEVHKPFILIDKSRFGRAIKYEADFVYERLDGSTAVVVVEDVKSEYTRKFPIYRLKKRLFAERYGIEITEVIT